MRQTEERSAGAIVFRRSGPSERLYLLLKYPAGHWDFPKGNIEQGEKPEATMVREIREETGLENVRIVEGFETVIEYFYKREGRRVHKEVIFFLAESDEEKVAISFEHQDYGWLRYDEAMSVVTYPNSKRVLHAAEDALNAAQKP